MVCIPVMLVGGTEVQTLNLVRTLITGGYNVIVCCYYEYDEQVVEIFRENGVKVLLMKIERRKGLFYLIRMLKPIFRKIRPDIVHVQYVAPGLVPILAARAGGIRTVFATVHQPGRTYGFKEKCLLRFGALICTSFFCVSLSVEESWFGNSALYDSNSERCAKRKHYTIYNAVDTFGIEKAIKETNRSHLKKSLNLEKSIVIGIVGRIREEKGVDTLVKAMPKVIKAIPNVQLLIIGDGPDRTALEQLSEKLGIQDHLYWIGAKSPDAVLPYYAIMDIAVVPSRFEGFGLSAAEAMAAGVPVIASDVDGLKEVVRNEKTGFHFPVGQNDLLASKLIHLLKNPDTSRRMGRLGRAFVWSNFSMTVFSNSVLGIYKQFTVTAKNLN